ncbi:Transportin-1 [Gracilariopsis chorda]|uniref:Transportin-1 n=1 Tax=Gracilariopsis chorda TaxID=448386 RepID=A0A2V3J4D3_9FLOR|nr:Transportin-1 [Gracilariopsis chorda]|eukprot:PXF49278.1 Transportin-1 [Gracilariopsis chorda]
MASVAMNSSHLALASTTSGEHPNSCSTPLAPASQPQPTQWAPAPEKLHAIATLLRDSTSAYTNVQQQVYNQLQKYSTVRDFNNYLVYILAHGYNSPDAAYHSVDAVRQAAGLVLKNNIRLLYNSIHPHSRQYINSLLLAAIGDTSYQIRAVAATCISTIVDSMHTLASCSGLTTTLIHYMDSDRLTYIEGALTVLSALAEDVPLTLNHDVSRPLDVLIPKLIHLCAHPSETIRAKSVQILNHLLLGLPSALRDHVDVFIRTLFSIADDSSAQVRKRVCTSICLLTEAIPQSLAPYLTSVIEFMLASSSHSDELIAREACEFWILVARVQGGKDVLRSYLPRLVPIILDNMVYSKDEVALYNQLNKSDDTIPDTDEDIRPRFHQPRFVASGSNHDHPTMNGDIHSAAENGSQVGSLNANGTANGSNDSSTGGYDSDDDDGYESSDLEDFRDDSEWTLRKCSASAIDMFSHVFGDELLDHLLPRLESKVADETHWEQRECGVLALGAIAEGCYQGMLPALPRVASFLFGLTEDQHNMVRSIACWTLSRYSKWIINEKSRFEQLVDTLLKLTGDSNKLVQKAACSSLAMLAEESGTLIAPFLPPILGALSHAFSQYQKNNLIALYDVVCTLADAVGTELAVQEHMTVLMPLLTGQWNATSDNDSKMLSLLECLSHVFRALGMSSQQYAGNIFSRCTSIMDTIYNQEARGERDDNHIDFLTCCLDLMCALAEALGPNVDPFMSNNGNGGKPVLPLLFAGMKDRRQEVRQSAFALLGELARARTPSLIPALTEYVEGTVEALNPEYMSVSNNATWALGELVMMAGFLPPSVPINRDVIQRILVERALDSLIRVVNTPQLNRSLLENSALTLGRMGLVMSESMAPRLGQFAEAAFSQLRNIRDDIEKEQAFHGMNAMVRVNPTAIMKCFGNYLDAIGSWFHCKPDLEMEFASILHGYKQSLGDQWFSLFNSFSSPSQSLLKERFAL